jgi:F0F1-type ATP synthase epsilon subunit
VFSDGSSGVATITITGTTSKAVLGVETVTFYGSVATITTTVRTAVVSSLGGATSGASALVAVVKDSLGTIIPAGSVYAQSGTTASIPDATCTYSSTYKGHACSLVPVASKTGSVTFTVRNAVRATTVASTTISSADVSVTLGEAPAKVAMSFDKSVYGQGEAAKLSLTLTDKNGKPVANGIYADILDADMIESTYALTGLTDTHTVTAATSTGTMVISVNMPIAEVDIAVTGTTGTGFATLADQGVAVAAGVVSVKSNSSSAATDAANEATDAANAATDAANAAAEAADAATAAAQDAADAVAALSTEVATLIAALKKQITSLTNLVIKIQKKVKA